jgi:hypothetical protein
MSNLGRSTTSRQLPATEIGAAAGDLSSDRRDRMLLTTVFKAAIGPPGLGDTQLPLEVEPNDGISMTLDDETGGLHITVRRSVDASQLELVRDRGWYRELEDGTREPLPRVRLVGDEPPERVLVDDFVSALTFLTDALVALSRPPDGDRLVAETDEERVILERLGSDKPFIETTAQISCRTFNPIVDAEALLALRNRAPGTRLYADAMKLGLGVAQFRELWRVLESAFASKNDDLVECLGAYSRAEQLGFDKEELRAFLVLRGRASHAESKAGVREVAHVERECRARLPRLKSLVERVILTKASWGYPSLGIDELTPVRAYVRRDGGITVVQQTTDS